MSAGLAVHEQIAHIREHQDKFDQHQQKEGADVAAYFASYLGDHPDLYYNLCMDLGIEPRGDWSHLWEEES